MEKELPMTDIQRTKHDFLNLVPIAILVTDTHSKVLYANQHTESLFGYKKSEIEGQRIRKLFLEDDLVFFLPNIFYLTLYRRGFDGEVLLQRKDRSKIIVRLFTTTFKEEAETFISFWIQEIQRLKNLERERLEAERWASLGRMVEEIAHQVRNPIVSIGGFAKRLQRIFSSTQKSYSYLDQILHETRKLETMIRRVEEYVQIPKPSFERENIQEIVEAALQSFSKEASQAGVSFNLETRDLKENGHVFLDRGLVIQAISHVLKNSLEALAEAPPGKETKTVTLTLFAEEENIGVSISDKGRGIPRKNLNLIFEPFFSTRPDHVGLGLTLVQRVIGEHSGEVQVESRLKKGTTITLAFPKDRRRKIRRELISQEAAVKKARREDVIP
jgi:PAS domain S-box-containing protein